MARLESDEENDNDLKKRHSQSRAIVTTTKGNRSIRDDGTMAGLELDEVNDNDSRKSRAIVTIMKGNRSKSQVTATTATQGPEFIPDHQATQGREHQDEDPQDADLERGATYCWKCSWYSWHSIRSRCAPVGSLKCSLSQQHGRLQKDLQQHS